MLLQQQIEIEINNNFFVKKFIIENESHMHGGNNPESHFKIILVSDDFNGLSKVKRHQMVYKILQEIMPKFHALALHTFDNDEWLNFKGSTDSPNCLGGSVT